MNNFKIDDRVAIKKDGCVFYGVIVGSYCSGYHRIKLDITDEIIERATSLIMPVSKTSIEVEVPKGYEAKVYNGSQVLLEKKQKEHYSKTWKEFCKNNPYLRIEYIIEDGTITPVIGKRNLIRSKGCCASREEAEAFLALMQLRRIRAEWLDGVDLDSVIDKSTIIVLDNKPCIIGCGTDLTTLSFPSVEMANEFLTCFKDLINKAMILLK